MERNDAVRTPPPSFAGRLVLATLLLVVALPTHLAGNMAEPVERGAPMGEPSGGLATMTIEHETLLLDLRPLRDAKPAWIDVTYAIRNDGPRRTLDLVFVTGSESANGTVTVDGAAVPVRRDSTIPLPAAWRPPANTPHPWDEGEELPYEVERPASMRFTATLDSARHTIRVRYQARPTARSGDSPTVYWQLAYILAPARQWRGFGGLEARVLIPEGWRAASRPTLQREDDTLVRTWDRLPADALAITVQAPPPVAFAERVVPVVLAILGFFTCRWLGRGIGRVIGRRGWRGAISIPLSLLIAALWGGIAAFVTIAIPNAIKNKAGTQMAWTYGYGSAVLAVLTMPLAFLVAFGITQWSSLRARRDAGLAVGEPPAAGDRRREKT